MPYAFLGKKNFQLYFNATSRGISPHFALICLQILRSNVLAIACYSNFPPYSNVNYFYEIKDCFATPNFRFTYSCARYFLTLTLLTQQYFLVLAVRDTHTIFS